jgi:sialidase-1
MRPSAIAAAVAAACSLLALEAGGESATTAARVVAEMDLFSAADSAAYACFRTMSMVQTAASLHVFVEARRGNCIDQPSGGTDVLTRRSTDHGRSFSPARRLLGDARGSAVYRNPYATFDESSSRLLLNFVNTTNCSRTDPCFGRWTSLQMHSDTDGTGAWSSPTSVRWQSPTAGQQLRGDGSLMGPGHGVQLQHGAHKGRLVMCGSDSFRKNNTGMQGSLISVSDDAGKHWRPAALLPGASECQVIELSEGKLVFNGRGSRPGTGRDRGLGTPRVQAFSTSGGENWSTPTMIAGIAGPGAAGGLAYAASSDALWMSNPDTADGDYRANVSLSASLDSGVTWNKELQVYDGPSSYSVLSSLSRDERTGNGGGTALLGLLYERCNISEADPGPAPWHQCWWGRKRQSERVSFALIETTSSGSGSGSGSSSSGGGGGGGGGCGWSRGDANALGRPLCGQCDRARNSRCSGLDLELCRRVDRFNGLGCVCGARLWAATQLAMGEVRCGWI